MKYGRGTLEVLWRNLGSALSTDSKLISAFAVIVMTWLGIDLQRNGRIYSGRQHDFPLMKIINRIISFNIGFYIVHEESYR